MHFRDSATFAELEKMMTENDRDCANDDDTMSFEALESRMRTPYKGSAKRMEDKENSPSNLSGIEPMMNNTLATPIANVEEKEHNQWLCLTVVSAFIALRRCPHVTRNQQLG